MTETATAPVPAAPTTADLPELEPGDELEATFTCTDKRRLLTRRGAPYLLISLSDAHGTTKATVFDHPEAMAERFERGDHVRVRAIVNEYRGRNELKVDWIDRVATGPPPAVPAVPAANGNGHAPGPEVPAEIPVAFPGPAVDSLESPDLPRQLPAPAGPAPFHDPPPADGAAPATLCDPDELDGYLEQLSREVADGRLRPLLDALLANPILRAAWRRAPAAPGVHHAYPGGLLEHTVAVARLSQEAAQLHPRLDADLLLTAALVHDLGRTEEHSDEPPFARTCEGGLLGHLWLGAELVAAHARDLPDRDRVAELLHCVLHHHGPLPGTAVPRLRPEAMVLRRLCELDACAQAAPRNDRGLGREGTR